ncbi:hypothetical protein dsx2_2515 [Desulfovibrio sp. X2]|uniref:hypothetical protein n=1 Tax=Desulfovibrio sp. X2 TaxID=941449 RepID=UPI000358DA51|nr:hypothetical protein [Desulfovibrio sp. X2]EPR43155.1 hypothetical protein dsx2_2515 [Desulfovibrio sp. X2]
MKNDDQFERVFVALVAERVEDMGMSHAEFGRRVFGGGDSGVRLWRSVRDVDGRGRRLTIGEAYRMAEALGTDFPSLVWNLCQSARNRGMLPQDKSEQRNGN